MKNIILLLFAIVIAGCDDHPAPQSESNTDSLIRYLDKENGVVCYQVSTFDSRLSCVKVSDGVKQ